MKFCCASNAVVKIAKNINFSLDFFLNHILSKKNRFLEKINTYIRILEVLPVILTTYLPV